MEKLSPLKHFIWQQTFMKMTVSVGRCLKRKSMLMWANLCKHLQFAKSLCNLQELSTVFKEKHLNINIALSKFCTLILKWCVLAGSKMTHSVCVCSAHQKAVLPVDAVDWNLRYKDLITLILSCLKYSN